MQFLLHISWQLILRGQSSLEMRGFADPPKLPPSVGPYHFHSLIGRGGFSSVCTATYEPTQAIVAIKVITKSSVSGPKFETELSLMRTIDHPFIVAFYDFLEDDDNYYIVMEYCPNGTLLERVNKTKGLTEPLIRHVLSQLVSALDYLHNTVKVAHRDIKLENIMFDAYDNIRLIDFGLSRTFMGDIAFLHTACGSPAYASPEMLAGRVYGTAADMWSLGVAVYAMAYGKLPFRSANIQRLVSLILSEEPVYEQSVSSGLISLMKGLLCKDVQERLTIKQACSHSWLAGDVSVLGIEDIMKNHPESDFGDSAEDRMERREAITREITERKASGNRAGTDVQAIIQRMRENRKGENKSLPPLPGSPHGIRLHKGGRFGKSMNPRQARALHQAVVSIVAHQTPVRSCLRRLSEAAAHAPQLSPDFARLVCQ